MPWARCVRVVAISGGWSPGSASARRLFPSGGTPGTPETPKYSFRTLLKLSVDGITSFTARPLRLASQLGLTITLLAALYGSWIVAAKLLDPDRVFEGFSAIMVTMLFLGGAQLFAIGILGQYLGRVYAQTKGRPLYVVSDRVGWAPTPSDSTIVDLSLEPPREPVASRAPTAEDSRPIRVP